MLRIVNMTQALNAYRTLSPEFLAYAMPEYVSSTHRRYLLIGNPPKSYLLLLAFKLRELGNPLWCKLMDDGGK